MFDLVSTNETHFFREPKQFEFLSDSSCRPGSSSGGAPQLGSSGVERGLFTARPYSIAMSLLAGLPAGRSRSWARHLDPVSTSPAAVALEKSGEIPSDT